MMLFSRPGKRLDPWPAAPWWVAPAAALPQGGLGSQPHIHRGDFSLRGPGVFGLAILLWLTGPGLSHAQFHTNTITTPFDVYAYSVDGGPAVNPTIQLYAGVTNILNIQTSNDHPVVVTTTINPSDWYAGASPEDVNSEPMALSTPASGFPTVLYYVCSVHGFYGEIHFSPPAGPAPPPNTILSIRVGTNIVMTSTGTNTTWLLIPEFSSNLMQAAWSPVPSWTNRFANGTNTTVFNRLDPICGPNVFLRIRQQQN